MDVYARKTFMRAARKALLTETELYAAVTRAEMGMVDASLGSGLIKQRIARSNEGRSGGFRSIIFYRRGRMSVFLHLFAKNSKANISPDELRALQALAHAFESLTNDQVQELVDQGLWQEVTNGEG